MFSVAAGSSYMTKLQQQYTELSCKENVLEQTEGLLHIGIGPLLRPKQLEQQQMFSLPSASAMPYTNQQACDVSKVERECLVEDDSIPGAGGNADHLTLQAECGNKLSRMNLEVTPCQGHMMMSTTTPALPARPIHQRQPQQQTCKLRISKLLGLSNSSSESEQTLRCPLPNLQWVHADELWQIMRSKDTSKVAPEAELRVRHPGILSSMRIILLDWLMEVGVVSKLELALLLFL